MKFFSLILLALGITFAAQAQQFKKASLHASGLTCAMCSKATYESLASLPFVDKIDTDLDNTTFILIFKPNVPVNIDAIKNKVEDAGFSVAKLVMTANFDGVAVKNDTHINYSGSTLHFMNVKDQTLNGDQQLTVIDKDFVSSKQFKKFSSATTMACYQTGKMENCCHKTDGATAQRIYHVTI